MAFIKKILKFIITFPNSDDGYWSHSKLKLLGAHGPRTRVHNNVAFRNLKNIHLGDDTLIEPGVVIRPRDAKIIIGEGTGINCYAVLLGAITIGRFNMIGPHVTFAAGDHNISIADRPMAKRQGIRKPIVTHDDIWIGANAVICGGVTIGEGSVIAAGAVVTKDVFPYNIVAGVPARPIGDRKDSHV